ncbi:hypothetical protein LMH87_010310 [Akanthomyces muscarius]|uniref:Phosphatidylethanolamine-binding protein n=1 Tax=Akanthomyces muscarius TaxID=2231603 RepID=A0A9W8QDX6_AKAMU|nr:hypothetical protein LMH87_010310 [Akanthomyces muscarius]KAJ4153840.1 hypothetical protein LMH87_010310 [Akanthomyces muscarius]
MSQLTTSLEEAHLVPGAAAALIPASFAPSADLSVSFGDAPVQLGNLLRVSQVQQKPTISFQIEADAGAAASDSSYLVMLVDPDAPTPEDPKFAFWRHWVVSGLQPGRGCGAAATALTEFLGPGPKPESNPHRYLFLLFREPAGLALGKSDVGGEAFIERRSFDAATFVARHGLQLVGLNWVLCAADEWCA